MAKFWTSDTHYGQANIIGHCSRPFISTHAMAEGLIGRWNQVVTPKDTVYHLGDFAMKLNKEEMKEVLNRLNGKKILIAGNHDPYKTMALNGWDRVVASFMCMGIKGTPVVLIHDPERLRSSFNVKTVLHGHHHGSTSKHDHSPHPGFRYIDVGVDAGWDYTPVSEDQIIKRLGREP